MNQLGYYGKIHHRGDFVRFNLPQTFVTVWDDWLGSAMLAGRQSGDDWERRYDANTHHRFALSSDIAGPTPWIGVMSCSADKVGRRFPFCLACSLPREALACQALLHNDDWFVEAESLLFRVHRDDYPFDELQQALAALNGRIPQTFSVPDPADGHRDAIDPGNTFAICLDAMQMTRPEHCTSILLDQTLRHCLGDYSLWIRADGRHLQIGNGLPTGELADTLLTGDLGASLLHVIDVSALGGPDHAGPGLPATGAAISGDSTIDAMTRSTTPIDSSENRDSPADEPVETGTDRSATLASSTSPAASQPVPSQQALPSEPPPSADDWAALDAFENSEGEAVPMPDVEPLELEEDDQPEAPWER